jgi:allene oxide cyclase-like protein
MRRRTTGIAVGLAVVLGAAGLWAGAAQSANGATDQIASRGSTVKFDVQFSDFFVIDFSANGVRSLSDIRQSDPSIGDVSVFQDKIVKAGKVVGKDGGTCTITRIDLEARPPVLGIACQVTFDLPGGSVATQGLATDAPEKHLVITGGTGRYLGAVGEAVLTEFENNTGTVVFSFAHRG